MALMPEDLENKQFTPVRFSEGYDMVEVDEYLDLELLPRLRELIDENNRLTHELEEAHNRVAELEQALQEAQNAAHEASQQAPAAYAAPEQPAPAEDTTAPQAVVHEDHVEEEPEQAPVETEQHAVAEAPRETPDQSAAGIIALANRLHDEYVRNGEEERDRLIKEANEEHRRIVSDAEEKSRTTLENLEAKKGELEKSIETLRTFERDYRSRLRNYLENQLRDLDTTETQDKQANFGL